MKNKQYWEKLSNKYIEDTTNKTSDELRVWFKLYNIRNNRLLKHWGNSSWNIQEFTELLYSEEISQGKFRELVRFEMEKSFKKRVLDLKNQYRSQLSELKNKKLDKTIDEGKIKELETKIKTLEEL